MFHTNKFALGAKISTHAVVSLMSAFEGIADISSVT